ncbi:hypothetical protein J2Z65_002313 [Paenibacillus aceris]|uniref:Uncharacterized protein n=1 Tax=Paenibacillus aceris TaxID=869555 RepID=A0ABS4HWS3_9BACL|nr:hypothetical protein [Paenibacillus aceris]
MVLWSCEEKGRGTTIRTQKEMLFIVQSQLAIDLNCSIDDLNGEHCHSRGAVTSDSMVEGLSFVTYRKWDKTDRQMSN